MPSRTAAMAASNRLASAERNKPPAWEEERHTQRIQRAEKHRWMTCDSTRLLSAALLEQLLLPTLIRGA